jgi:hypothetical protein
MRSTRKKRLEIIIIIIIITSFEYPKVLLDCGLIELNFS